MPIDLELEEKIKDLLAERPLATWVLALKLDMRGETQKVRKTMKSMAQRGLVRRDSFLSAANSTVWKLLA